MKKLIGPFMFAMVLGVGMASLSFAAGDMAAPSYPDGQWGPAEDRRGVLRGERYGRQGNPPPCGQDHCRWTAPSRSATRSRPRPRKRTTQRPLNTFSPRCRFWDTNVEVRAQRLGQSSGLAQSIPRRLGTNILAQQNFDGLQVCLRRTRWNGTR